MHKKILFTPSLKKLRKLVRRKIQRLRFSGRRWRSLKRAKMTSSPRVIRPQNRSTRSALISLLPLLRRMLPGNYTTSIVTILKFNVT